MAEDNYPKELFDFEQPKKTFSGLSNMLPKADFEGRIMITLTLEKMIFIAIGIMMLMVIVYAFGVESGKARAKILASAERAMPANKDVQPSAAKTTPAPVKPAPVIPATLNAQNRLPAATQQTILSAAAAPRVNTLAADKYASDVVKKEPVRDSTKPYTVVAAAFSAKQAAQAEVARMKRNGFAAYLVYSEPYYLACIGAYPDKDGAQSKRELARIKRFYKDAYFRSR